MIHHLFEVWLCTWSVFTGYYALEVLVPTWHDAAEVHAGWTWRNADPFEHDGPCMTEEDVRSRRRALTQHARTSPTRTHVVTDHPGVYTGCGLKIRDLAHRFPTRGHSHVLMSLEPGEDVHVHRVLDVCESTDRVAQMAYVSTDSGTEGWSVLRVESRDWVDGEWVEVWARYLEEVEG